MNLEYIFVYGVFRDYGLELLEHAIFCDMGYVYGHIYAVNEFYPGYVFGSCNDKVWGDIYLIDPSVFPKLDEFEGDEYIRRKIWTSIGEECWIYEYVHPVLSPEITGGDWILRKNFLKKGNNN